MRSDAGPAPVRSPPDPGPAVIPGAAEGGASGRNRPSRRILIRWVIGLAVGIAVVSVVVGAAGGLADARRALGRTAPGWVALAVGAEVVSYVLIGLQLRRLARPSVPVSRRLGMSLALVVAGFGLLTPASPAEGLAIAGRELRRRGLDQGQAVLTLGFGQWFSARMFVLVAALNVIVAVALGDLPAVDFLPVLAVATIVLAGLVLTARLARRASTGERAAVLLGGLRFWRPRPPVVDRRAAGAAWHRRAMSVVGSPANRAVLAALAAGALLADIGCLWASLAAAGVGVDVDVVVLASTAGVLATVVPLVPGGLGLVEAVVPAVLHHFGAPLDTALAGALIYRAVGTFLPATIGAGVVGGLTLTRRRSRAGALP